ncbi:hypothetical protein MCEHALHM7_00882 [Methylophilaceae bacterium]
MPIAILNEMIPLWNVTHIVLSSESLLKSYAFLKSKYPYISIVESLNSYHLYFRLISVMLKTHFTKMRIVFFHECCQTIFDILVKILHPKGHFYPQVTMNGFEVSRNCIYELPFLIKIFLKLFHMEESFNYYKGYKDNNSGRFIALTSIKYPFSIKCHSIYESRKIFSRPYKRSKYSKKIIFLAGRDAISDKKLIKIYSDMINLACKLNYKCFIKDHPSARARLNIKHPLAENIDPFLPVELLDMDFAFAVGVSSTSLLHFRGRAISILNIVTLEKKKIKLRKAHLLSLSETHEILFLNSLKNFKEIIYNNLN